MTTTVFAAFGDYALPLLYLWLLAGIVCSYLANRKGYGERPGLATGLLLSVIGIAVWLFVPARRDSDWKLRGPFGRERKDDVAEPQADASTSEGPGSRSANA